MSHEHRADRRTPSGIQRLNQWLLPILVVGVLSAMGFYAIREQTTSLSLERVVTKQNTVIANQAEMKEDIADIKINLEKAKDALNEQNHQLKLDRIRITTMHHQRAITTCHGCHEKGKK